MAKLPHLELQDLCKGMDATGIQAKISHLELRPCNKLIRAAGQLWAVVCVPPPAIRPHILHIVMWRLCHSAAEGARKLPAAIQPDHVRVHVGFALAATHWAVRSWVHHLQ